MLRRTFSGTLEARAQMAMASKIGGRIERLLVDRGDPVERGRLVAVLVPEAALTRRGHRTGVFAVSADGRTVSWRAVRAGIRDNGRVQLLDSDVTGQVVTLGQQLIEDGSAVTIAESSARPQPSTRPARPASP